MVNLISESGFNATRGQNLSFLPVPKLLDDAIKAYWQATILKSGSLFRMACAGGAVAGTNSSDFIEALGDYGASIGVIMQVVDDCRDMLDERTGKIEVSLPVLLYSASLPDQEILFPDSHSYLRDLSVPEVVTAALATWWSAPKVTRNLLNHPMPKEYWAVY